MTNQQSTLTAKCPSCGVPATQPEIHETCVLAKNNASDSFAALLENCVIPDTLKKFHDNNIGEDPCMNCKHNRIIETPGSFLKMQDGETANTWLEIHVCPTCQTTYSVNTKTNATLAM